jgi:dihydroflavonol-4-reductase
MISGKNMTTYFITGGFGFLGQYIVKAIHEHDRDAELRVLVRTKRKTLLGVESMGRVRLIYGELSKPDTYVTELQGVDTIIHNAALVSFKRSDADAVFLSNVIGTRNLSQAALDAGCKSFIFISSISAIGLNPNGLSDESLLPDLEVKRRNDMYGYSKRISELELMELTNKMRIIVLNPSVVLGPGSERIHAVYRLLNFVPILPMMTYVNSFVDVRDVARAVVLARSKGRNGERYVVTAWNVDMLTLARQALQLAGKKNLLVPVSGGFVRLMDAMLWILDVFNLNPGLRRFSEMDVDKPFSNEKIKREMGWEPQFTLEQSISDSVKEI